MRSDTVIGWAAARRSPAAIAMLALLLAQGCASPNPATPAMEAEFGAACAAQGHPAGTPAYQACLSTYPRAEPAGDKAARIKSQM